MKKTKIGQSKEMTRAMLRRGKLLPQTIEEALRGIFTDAQIERLKAVALRHCVAVQHLIAACAMDGVQQSEAMGVVYFENWRGSARGRRGPWPRWFRASKNVVDAETAAGKFARRSYKEWLAKLNQNVTTRSPTSLSEWRRFIDEARAFGFDPVFVKVPEASGFLPPESESQEIAASARRIRKAARV